MTRRFKRLLCYYAIIAIALISGIIGFQYSIRPTHCMVTVDTRFSDTLVQDIQRYVHEWLQKKSLKDLGASLQNQFELIDEVSIRHKRLRTACMRVVASKPLLSINNRWVLTEKGCIAHSDHYSDKPLIGLMTFQDCVIAQQADYFRQALNHFHPTIWASYDVMWRDHTAICLHSRDNDGFCILVHAQMHIDEELLKKINIIKSSVCKKTKEKTRWLADVRFKNQIIISHQPIVGSPNSLGFKKEVA